MLDGEVIKVVNIKEIQYVKDSKDKEGYQERIIQYSSWEDYINDVLKFDGMKRYFYPSIPKQYPFKYIEQDDNYIWGEFFHRVLNKVICHEAFVVDENN